MQVRVLALLPFSLRERKSERIFAPALPGGSIATRSYLLPVTSAQTFPTMSGQPFITPFLSEVSTSSITGRHLPCSRPGSLHCTGILGCCSFPFRHSPIPAWPAWSCQRVAESSMGTTFMSLPCQPSLNTGDVKLPVLWAPHLLLPLRRNRWRFPSVWITELPSRPTPHAQMRTPLAWRLEYTDFYLTLLHHCRKEVGVSAEVRCHRSSKGEMAELAQKVTMETQC